MTNTVVLETTGIIWSGKLYSYKEVSDKGVYYPIPVK